MKITHTESGKNYQIYPGTKLKIERTNPFFSEYGEQSLPIDLPNTVHNDQLLGNPSNLANKKKVSSMIDCTIASESYYMKCRQAILSVTPQKDISTSFYMNEGSFYSRIENTYLSELFADECVEDIATVDQAIAYLKNLNSSGGDDRFSIFQVELDADDNGTARYLNGNIRTGGFINESITSETVSGQVLSIPIGFYMTPFMKVNYLLKRLFAHFGYTIEDNFFTSTHPFPDMVVLNNVADAIVTGTIRLGQLVPNVTCSEFLELIRKKFCCEFITDEVLNTASIVLFNEIDSLKPAIDLSSCAVGQPTIEYAEYKQIKLKPNKSLDNDVDEVESLEILAEKFPDASWSEYRGVLYRQGYKMGVIPILTRVDERITSLGQYYFEGGTLTEEEIEVPETMPGHNLYIGNVQFLNSSIVINGSADDSTTSNSGSAAQLMLCFSHKHQVHLHTMGSITNTIVVRDNPYGLAYTYKFADYSLVYIGPDGIYEKFYRHLDALYRNSLHKVKRKLLLSEHQKSSIPAHLKIVVNGIGYYIDKLNYYIGGKNEPVESELFTTQLYTPVSLAKSFSDIFLPPPTNYSWISKYELYPLSENDYNQHPYKDATYPTFFPPRAGVEHVGKKFNEIYIASPYGWDDDGLEASRYKHALCYSWMECVEST